MAEGRPGSDHGGRTGSDHGGRTVDGGRASALRLWPVAPPERPRAGAGGTCSGARRVGLGCGRHPATAPWWVALVAAVRCSVPPFAPPVVIDPLALDVPDVRLEQGILGRFFGREFLARGIVVKQGARLDVFLLTPTGQRLYHVRQERKAITVHAAVDPWAQLKPEYLLRDVRWLLFERCPGEGAGPSECGMGAETLVETRDPQSGEPLGLLVRAASGDAEVRFEGRVDCDGLSLPRRATLTSRTLDYSIEALVERCTRLAP